MLNQAWSWKSFCLAVVLCSTLATKVSAQQQLSMSTSPQGSAPQMRNGLPPTTLDSFVYEAGEHKEHIYGDEGTTSIPPYMGFSKPHRINTGIMDQRDQGLTTGHGSLMPDAWGRDEFLGQEWTQSGARGRTSAMGMVDGNPETYSGDGGGGGGQNLPPAPGPGYQPMYQHGEFVGWWSPEEIALAQTDYPAALRSIVNSDRYYGGELGRLSILYEIGDVPSPFPPGYMGG